MAKKIIIQIGRLDRHYRNKITFSYGEEEGESELSSSFLMTTNSFIGSSRLLLFPKSLVFQNWNDSTDEFIASLRELDLDEYMENPRETFKRHPHVAGSDFLILDSMGKYIFNGQEITMNSRIEDITNQIYSLLICKYSYYEIEEICIDVSSGLNIYVAALLNSLYRFIPFTQFRYFLEENKKRVQAFLLNSDPIIGKPSYTIPIQKSKFSSKAFNVYAYKDGKSIENLVREIYDGADYINELTALVNIEYFLLQGVFIYGTPGLLMLTNHQKLKRIFEDFGVNEILSRLSRYFNRSGKDDKKYFQPSILFSFSYALAISNSIYFQFKGVIQTKELNFNVIKKGKRYSTKNLELENAYLLLQEGYGQPKPDDYKKELKLLVKNVMENAERMPNRGQFMSIGDFLNHMSVSYKQNKTFETRNYFAHGGWEKNITEFLLEDNVLKIRYNSGSVDNEKGKIIDYLKK